MWSQVRSCTRASQAPSGFLVGRPPQRQSLVGNKDSFLRHIRRILSKASTRRAASGWGSGQQNPKCWNEHVRVHEPSQGTVLSGLKSVHPFVFFIAVHPQSCLGSGPSLGNVILREVHVCVVSVLSVPLASAKHIFMGQQNFFSTVLIRKEMA